LAPVIQATAETRDAFGGYRNHQLLYLLTNWHNFDRQRIDFALLLGMTLFSRLAQIAAEDAQAQPFRAELPSRHSSL